MSDPDGVSRPDLYANWFAWATSNLGSDPQQAAAAANAAADVAVHGDGYTAAENAARAAWYRTAQTGGPVWRPGFWSLLLTSPWAWILPAGIVIFVLSFAAAPTGFSGGAFLGFVAMLVGLVAFVWQVGYAFLLSNRGMVAPASLLRFEIIQPSGRSTVRSYDATYQFEFQGRLRAARHRYFVRDSIRQDVMVLFYPKLPWIAKVLPEVLTPNS